MQTPTLAFIGAGNMSRSLITGLIQDGYPAAKIWASNPNPTKLQHLEQRFSIHTSTDNCKIIAKADVIILAVKPQTMPTVLSEIQDALKRRNYLIISIAAGITCEAMQTQLGKTCRIVRAMPNTPALVGNSATSLFATTGVSDNEKAIAESILRAVGVTVWFTDESLLDVATAVAGSGPAYFFLVMELLQEAAVELGIQESDARLLVLQTAFGASHMALQSELSLAQLRHQVTSPGGTTETAITHLESGNMRQLFIDAVKAAVDRAKNLAGQ